MVYKKFITKNGKTYGPYLYHSERVDGRVVSNYHGSENVSKKFSAKKPLIVGIVFSLVLIFSILFLLNNFLSTGKIIFEPQHIYSEGELLKGSLELVLEEGEFVPASTLLSIGFGDDLKIFEFRDIVDEAPEFGNYFVEGFNLSGEGEGYGVETFVEGSNDVDFVLKIYSEDESSSESEEVVVEENETDSEDVVEIPEELIEEEVVSEEEIIVEDVVEEVVEEPVEEIIETPEVVEEVVEEVEVPEEPAPITGEVISERLIEGVVSSDEPFVYDLDEGENVEIVSSSEDVDFVIEDGQVIVTTDYVEDLNARLIIDLEELNISAQEGSLEMSIIYDGVILASDSKNILIEDLNETILNETESNETIVFDGNVSITTLQFNAVVGKPVKWKKIVSINQSSNFSVAVHKEAENISVYKVVGETEQVVLDKTLEERISEDYFEEKVEVEEVKEKVSENSFSITGEITAKIKLEKKFSLVDFIVGSFRKLTGTGRVVDEFEETKEVVIEASVEEELIEVEYETPAPVSYESNLSNGKEIVISSEIHYENILAYTEIEETESSSIKLYHLENGTRTLAEFEGVDLNENGLVDIVFWVVPHLSNQTYQLIIEISKAEHLDMNRTFISDIYESVKALDGNYSEVINDGEFVRVTFEIPLDSSRDITIYPRGNGSVEVYEMGGEELIADFGEVVEGKNTIYLNNLNGTQDVFDLKVVGGSLEFDWIVDPDVSDCGAIDAPGNYQLTSNITDSNAPYCINISVSDVYFDCQNNMIDGNRTNIDNMADPQSGGIIVNWGNSPASNLTNISIVNCNLKDWYYGIVLTSVNNSQVLNSFINYSIAGISLSDAYSVNVSNTQMIDSYSTYNSVSGSNNLLEDSIFRNSLYGPSFSSSQGTINNISVSDISFYAVFLNGPGVGNILNNSVINSSLYGMVFSNDDGGNLVENTNFSNCSYGVGFSGSINNTLRNNYVTGNTIGLYFTESANSSIYNNYFNNTNNSWINNSGETNYFNITKTLETSIVSGINLGGNYWANSSGTGFSETCAEGNSDGICDSAYDLETGTSCTVGVDCGNYTDYLPLTVTFPSSCNAINDSHLTVGVGGNCTELTDCLHVLADTEGSFCNLTDSDTTYTINASGQNFIINASFFKGIFHLDSSVTNVIIDCNYSTLNDSNSISNTAMMDIVSSNLTIQNCYFENANTGILLTNTNNLTFRNCSFSSGSSIFSNSARNASNVLFDNNNFTNVAFSMVGAVVSDINFTNNNFGLAGNGINFQPSDNSYFFNNNFKYIYTRVRSNTTFDNNDFDGALLTGGAYAFDLVTSGTRDVIISDNSFYNFSDSVPVFKAVSYLVSNITIEGNTFQNTSYAVYSSNLTNSLIQDNIFDGSSSEIIYLFGNSSNNKIINNTFKNNGVVSSNTQHFVSSTQWVYDGVEFNNSVYLGYLGAHYTNALGGDNAYSTDTDDDWVDSSDALLVVDGSNDYDLWLSSTCDSFDGELALVYIGSDVGWNTCADVEGVFGAGCCDLYLNEVFIANGLTSDYTYNSSGVASVEGLSLKEGNTNPPYINYKKLGARTYPGLHFDSNYTSVENNTFINLDDIFNSYEINVSGSHNNFSNNNFLNYSYTNPIADSGTGNLFCVNGVGNFYKSNLVNLPSGDCGNANVTTKSSVGTSTATLGWTPIAGSYGSKFYDVYGNNSNNITFLETTSSASYSGTYYHSFQIVPWLNGSRYNATTIYAIICAQDWGAWSAWSTCSASSQSRTRTDSTSCVQTQTQSCTETTTTSPPSGGGLPPTPPPTPTPEPIIPEPVPEIIVPEDCVPVWNCGNYGSCSASYTTEDVLNNVVSVSGVETRTCSDSSGCASSYSSSRSCSISVPVNTEITEEGLDIFNEEGELVSAFAFSNIPGVSSVQRLDIFLGSQKQASHCINGVLDSDETEVDCGGIDCFVCVNRVNVFDWAFWLRISLWVLFIVLYIVEVYKEGGYELKFLEPKKFGLQGFHLINEKEIERKIGNYFRVKKKVVKTPMKMEKKVVEDKSEQVIQMIKKENDVVIKEKVSFPKSVKLTKSLKKKFIRNLLKGKKKNFEVDNSRFNLDIEITKKKLNEKSF